MVGRAWRVHQREALAKVGIVRLTIDGQPAPLRNPFDKPRFCCDEAARLARWVDLLITRLTDGDGGQPTAQQLWEAKAKLVDEYRKERNGATKAHRDRLTDKHGDHCIHGVFIDALERLADVAVDPTITPPVVSPQRKEATERSPGWMEELADKLTSP